MRPHRVLTVAWLLVVAFVLGSSAAFAGVPQPGLDVADGCIGVERLAGSTTIRVGIAVTPGHDGKYQAGFDTLNGKVTGTGTVSGGRGVIPVPIQQLGPYTNLVIVFLDAGQNVGLGPLANLLPFVVGPASITCDASTLRVPPPGSATSSTSSSEPSTTTTVPTTSSTSGAPAGTVTKRGGTPVIWTVLVALGLMTAAAGLYLLVTPDPCRVARKRWEGARRECETARRATADAGRAVEQARGVREAAQRALDVRAAPGLHDAVDPSERSRLEAELVRAQRDEQAAGAEVGQLETVADEVCAAVAELEAAYRRCVESAPPRKAGAVTGVPAPSGPLGAQGKPPVRVGAAGSAPEPISSGPPGVDGTIRDEKTEVCDFWIPVGDEPVTIAIPGAMNACASSLSGFEGFDPGLEPGSTLAWSRQYRLVVAVQVRKHTVTCHTYDAHEGGQWHRVHELADEPGEERTNRYRPAPSSDSGDLLSMTELRTEIVKAKAWVQRHQRLLDDYRGFVRRCNRQRGDT